MKRVFLLERYLTDLRERTAWAPDSAIEDMGLRVSRAALYRIGHLWALGLLDCRFETLLLPVLATESPVLDALERESGARGWGLSRDFFEERLRSGACLLFFDGADEEEWPGNARFRAG